MSLTDQARLLLKLEAQNNTGKPLSDLNRSLDAVRGTVMKLVGALAAGLGLKSIVDDTRRWADELDLLQDTLGVTSEEAATLNSLARITNTTASDLARGFTIFGAKIRDAFDPKTPSVIRDLGIEVKNLDGTARPFMDVLDEVRRKFGTLRDDLNKAAIAQELFGRGSRNLHDILAMSDDEFKRFDSRTKNLARVLGGDGVAAFEQLDRSQRSAMLGLTGLKIAMGVPLMQAFDGLINKLADLAFSLIPKVEAATRGMIAAFQILWGFVSTVAQTFGTLVSRIAQATGFTRIFSSVAKSAAETIRGFLTLIKMATDRVDSFRKSIDEKGLTGAMRLMFESLPGPMQTFITALGTFVTAFKQAIDGDFSTALTTFKEGLGGIRQSIGETASLLEGKSPAQQFALSFATAGIAIHGAIAAWNIASWIAGPLVRASVGMVALVGGWPALLAAALVGLVTVVALNFDKITAFVNEWAPRVMSFIREHFWTGMVGISALIGAWPLAALLLAAINLDRIAAVIDEWAPRFGKWLGDSIIIWVQGAGRLFRELTTWMLGTGLPSLISAVEQHVPRFGKWLTDSIHVWLANAGELAGSLLRWAIADFAPALAGTMWNDVAPAMWRWITEGMPLVAMKLAEWSAAIVRWVLFDLTPAAMRGFVAFGGAVVRGIIDGLGGLKDKLVETIGDSIRGLRIDIGPFHLSADGFRIDAPQLPSIDLSALNPFQNTRQNLGGVPNESLPGFAAGAIVKPRAGGVVARVGDGGEAEAIIPLSKLGSTPGSGGGRTLVFNIAGSVVTERELVKVIRDALGQEVRLMRQYAA